MNIGLPLGLTLTDHGKVAIGSNWGSKAKKWRIWAIGKEPRTQQALS
jgi:hypothetical protein